MKRSKIIFPILLLVSVALAAKATTKRTINTYFYKDRFGYPNAVQVRFTCFPNAFGCLGTAGSSLGIQLFTAVDLRVPLHH